MPSRSPAARTSPERIGPSNAARQVPARRGPSGRWCIPWDPATQEIYRQKVSGSFRLKPVPAAQADRSQD
jgi:hypothetical protein